MISTDRTKVSFGNQNYINNCNRKFSNDMYCANIAEHEVSENLEKNLCETNIIIFDNPTNCAFKKHNLDEITTIKTLGKIVLSAEPGLKLSVNCNGLKQTYVNLPESGVKILPDSCNIVGAGFRFESVKTHVETLGDLNIDFHLNSSIKHDLDSSHPINEIIKKFGENLNDSNTIIGKYRENTGTIGATQIAAFTSLMLTSILVIMVIIMGYIYITNGKLRSIENLKEEAKSSPSGTKSPSSGIKSPPSGAKLPPRGDSSEDYEEDRGVLHE